MGLNIYKESFSGSYNGITPSTMMEEGGISGGQNMRKISSGGGWKGRGGNTLMNTTAGEDGTAIRSLHYYEHPRNGDTHFIKQINNKLLSNSVNVGEIAQEDGEWLLQENGEAILWEAGGGALDASIELGGDMGVTVGATPGFSCQVGEYIVYADGSGPPLVWGGENPFCRAFLVVLDGTTTVPNDYTSKVIDGRDSTFAVLSTNAAGKFYVVSPERASGVKLEFVTVNTTAETLTVKAWRTDSFDAVAGLDDSTEVSGTTTMAQNGIVAWNESALDTMRIFGGVMGYVYEFSFSGAIEAAEVTKCQVLFDITEMSNKWDSVWNDVANVVLYDAANYKQVYGSVSNESEEQVANLATATKVYIKTVQPAAAFGIGIVPDKYESDGAKISALKYWSGSAWTDVFANISDLTNDGSNSFARSGVIAINNADAITPQKVAFETVGDFIPGYWYEITFDAAIGADTEMYLTLYAPQPESLGDYNGCAEFNGDLYLWGDRAYGNRLRYANWAHIDCFVGPQAGYTAPFGDESPVKRAINLDKYLIVLKDSSVWGMGLDRVPFRICDGTGIASPQSAVVSEIGVSNMKKDELVKVLIWQDTDGIYMFDGQTTVKKISPPIDHYFNPEYSTAISTDNIDNLSAFMDHNNDEYHLCVPDQERVFSTRTLEWYPAFVREMPLSCGITIKTPSGRKRTYGGTETGFLLLLENDTTDKDSSNADVAIIQALATRELEVPEILSFNLRRLWFEFKNKVSGSTGIYIYKNGESAVVDFETVSMAHATDSSANYVRPMLDMSLQRINSFKLYFYCSTADVQMQIHNLFYEIEAIGLTGK